MFHHGSSRLNVMPRLLGLAFAAVLLSTPQAQAQNVGCEATYTDSFKDYIRPGWQDIADYPNNQQKFILASDPQPFRAMTQRSPYAEKINSTQWYGNIDRITEQIRTDRQASYYVPLIINGDLTEFGHGNERKAMQRKMKQANASRPGPLMLPGMGNHDYDQNVGDCGNNGCARDSVCDMLMWVKTLSPASFDYRWDNSKRTHRGSFAYSVDVGRVRVVQLHLEPTYTRYFETGGGFAHNKKARFSITSAMDWLERDLKTASERGQYVIVNLHKRSGWQDTAVRDDRFRKLLEQHKVVAVFAGHLHNQLGAAGTIGKVPVFQTGAMLAESYLRVTFDWSTYKMHVVPVALGRTPPATRVIDLERKPDSPVKVTLYANATFTGSRCEVTLKSPQSVNLNTQAACSFSPKSAKVSPLPAGQRLCFEKADGSRNRCFNGSLTRAFETANFDLQPQLPPGMQRTIRGYPMNGHVDRLVYSKP